MKACIFHYPEPVEDRPACGSALRPNRMLAAFRAIGYEVDTITGYGGERKKQIAAIRAKIAAGKKYDFLYAESVNIPMLLAEEDHIPRYPRMDFAFFRFCRRHGIPTGLFYRDMHWRFPYLLRGEAFWKRTILQVLFRWDLLEYRRSLDVVFLSSLLVQNYVLQGMKAVPLPPGGDEHSAICRRRTERKGTAGELRLFYVGALEGVYDMHDFFRAVCETDGVLLTVCTPEAHWEKVRSTYDGCLCERIKLLHLTSEELQPYYEWADVAVLGLQRSEYLDLAMPIKVFEAISYGTPILATDATAVAALIQEKKIGWICCSEKESFQVRLEQLKQCPEEIEEKTRNTAAVAPNNTWTSRAAQAAETLNALRGRTK